MNAAKIRTGQDCMHQRLIWIKVHIYSVKAKSQAGNIRFKYIMTTQKDKKNKLGILGISSREFTH